MGLNLYMLGVIHRDPQGGTRLRDALRALPWGLVSVEVSPFALHFRRREGPALWRQALGHLPQAARQAGLAPQQARTHPGLAWLKAYLEQPYEWTVSLAEARARGAPCLALDISGLSRRLLADAHELVGVDNLAHLLASRQPAGAALELRRARDLLAGRGGWPRPEALEPEREAVLARRLTRLAAAGARRGLAPLVHVGGWRHLLAGQDAPALADRLGVPPERRILV
jgi:hypothetical protein